MKPSTLVNRAARVDAVLERLQLALSQGGALPGLDELSTVANLSAFHFHRVWRALTGEPLGHTVVRLRLLRALHLLEDGGSTVTDVALASGYDSAQSLARAFRAALDAAPGDVRGDPVRIAAARRRLQPATAREPAALQVEVVSLAPFEVVAVRRQGAFDALDAGFAQLFDWAASVDMAGSITGLHGVPLGDHRDLAPEQLVFDCAIRLDASAPALPLSLHRQMLGGGLYARVHHVGAYSGLEALADQVLRGWWPDSGHDLRDDPIHYAFLDDPDEVPAALLRADLYLPLRV